jgi:hypothetical protein
MVHEVGFLDDCVARAKFQRSTSQDFRNSAKGALQKGVTYWPGFSAAQEIGLESKALGKDYSLTSSCPLVLPDG